MSCFPANNAAEPQGLKVTASTSLLIESGEENQTQLTVEAEIRTDIVAGERSRGNWRPHVFRREQVLNVLALPLVRFMLVDGSVDSTYHGVGCEKDNGHQSEGRADDECVT